MLMRMLARCYARLTLGVLCVGLCFRACALVSIILSRLDLHQCVVRSALITGRVHISFSHLSQENDVLHSMGNVTGCIAKNRELQQALGVMFGGFLIARHLPHLLTIPTPEQEKLHALP